MSTESFSTRLNCLQQVRPLATRLQSPQKTAAALWEQTHTPMVEWQLNGTIVDWNPAAALLFGISAEEAIGENLFIRLLTDTNSLPLKTLLQTKRNQVRNMKTLHRHASAIAADQDLLCEWNHTLIPLSDEASSRDCHMLSTITDITHYIHTKSHLRDVQKNLTIRTQALKTLTEKHQGTLEQLAAAQSNCHLIGDDLSDLQDYPQILAASTDVMVVLDRHGIYQKILPTNPSPLFKLNADWIGKSIRELLSPLQADQMIQSIQSTLDQQQKTRLDYHLLIGEEHIWFDAVMTPIDLDEVLLVARNVTDRKHLETQLQASVDFLYGVFDTLPDPIFVKDEQHRWKLVNQATSELLGHPKELIVGVTDQDFLPPEEVRHQQEQDEMVLALSMPSTVETYLTDALGTRHFVSTKKTMFEDQTGKKFIVGSLRDLSDRKEMEDSLRQSEARSRHQALQITQALKNLQLAQSQLVQSEKMSSLGQLVAGVAHEINNPVNFIHGNVSYVRSYTQDLFELLNLYQKHYPLPHPELQETIEAIDLDFIISDLTNVLRSMETGTERIQQIVRSLRIFSRMDEAEMKSVNIHEGLDSALMLLDSRLKASDPAIEVHCTYDILPDIECYAGQLNQVFMNILTNAIDAIEEHRMSTCNQILISTHRLNRKEVEIRIKDSGRGISEREQQRLFDPFFTTKPIGKGTGMGLSICYQIITQHGGQLTCHSNLGEGAEFIIQIPIQLPPELKSSELSH